MKNIINVNALREALESGMSSVTIHQWVDDTIVAMQKFNKDCDASYIAVSKDNFKYIQERLDEVKSYYEMRLLDGLKF